MATPIEFVEEQWVKYQETNPQIEHIDTDELKKVLVEDLTYASSMDVREYTLYQKWCEIKERYPTKEVSTLFGQELQLVNPEQQKAIEENIKNAEKSGNTLTQTIDTEGNLIGVANNTSFTKDNEPISVADIRSELFEGDNIVTGNTDHGQSELISGPFASKKN